jgi:hypothetical protein
MRATTRIPRLPEEEITPLVSELLAILQLQAEQIQQLKDEIARLKGQKPKPKIKPSNLEKKTEERKTKNRRKKKKKTKHLEIDETIHLRPDNLPSGSKLKDYQDYVVQELIIDTWNIRYRRERWQTPSGNYVIGQLPKKITGSHFGPTLVSFILYQYYGCHVTQPLIHEQLRELGIDISTGQVNNIIIEQKDRFHREKAQILSMGLKMSGHINVDDTGARHKGNNGYCTHIGNEYFAWFESTKSKSRINFLKLLRAEHNDFIINDDALDYMSSQGLPKYQLTKFIKIKSAIFKDDITWLNSIKAMGIVSDRHVRIATEGALVGSIIYHGFNKDLAVISDDAGQFNVFLHGLCWVHAERSIHKLIGFNEKHREILGETRTAIWELYRSLKKYRQHPTETDKKALEKRFGELFTRKTGFALLDQALKRIHMNKAELLLVLDRPDIPLHNNLSESDIREYVKKRKISGSTRSDIGKKCRDTFTSLKKTCRKLDISFWKYLIDRVSWVNNIPSIADVMKSQMAKNAP